MQECFRQYPEIYGSELEDEEAEAEAGDAAAAAAPAAKAAPSGVPAAPLDEEDRQQLREAKLAQGRHSDAAETDNLPGVKLVESSVPRVAGEQKEQK
jgi:intermembrane space import and assembly protein 40